MEDEDARAGVLRRIGMITREIAKEVVSIYDELDDLDAFCSKAQSYCAEASVTVYLRDNAGGDEETIFIDAQTAAKVVAEQRGRKLKRLNELAESV
jgi:hypothetical protein